MFYQPLSISIFFGWGALPSKTSDGLLLCLDEGSTNPSGNVTLEGRMEKVKAVSHERVAIG